MCQIVGVTGVRPIVNTSARTPGGTISLVLIVVTTLVVAALFQPLRIASQRFIDRCFYRNRYDSCKTRKAFSAPLRQEADRSSLTGQPVHMITETMQPEHMRSG
jgi:hypothetical protein